MTIDGASLRDIRVLVLEDDYYLATDLQDALEAAGAIVIGPFGNEAEAERALADTRPDCAFIDVNLGYGPSFAIPHALAGAAIPFAFVTGYDADTFPDEFAGVARFEKPVAARNVVAAALRMLRTGGLRD